MHQSDINGFYRACRADPISHPALAWVNRVKAIQFQNSRVEHEVQLQLANPFPCIQSLKFLTFSSLKQSFYNIGFAKSQYFYLLKNCVLREREKIGKLRSFAQNPSKLINAKFCKKI